MSRVKAPTKGLSVRIVKSAKSKKQTNDYEAFKQEAIRRMKFAMTQKYSEYQSWVEEDKKSESKYKGVLAGPLPPKSNSSVVL